MTRLALLIVIPALALAAGCSPKHLRGGNGTGADGAYGSSAYGSGGGYGGANDPSNPRSPAYFESVVGDRVLFAVDQSSLSSEARAVLDGQVAWLQANTQIVAVVEGHADEQGTREYNLALGARRANAVYEYLVSRGVDPRRLNTVSFGKERPIEVCSAEACYAKNRRAVTVVAVGTGV